MKHSLLLSSIFFLLFQNGYSQYSDEQIKAYEIKYEKPYVLIDSTGKEIKSFYAKSVYDFHYGLARISKYNINTGKKLGGYMNTKGEIVIPLQFKKMRDFTESVARVMLPGDTRYTIIDKQGNPILNQTFADVFCKGRYCSFSHDDAEYKKLKKEFGLRYVGLIDVIDKKIILDKSKLPSHGFSSLNGDGLPIMTVVDLNSGKSGYSTVNNEMISTFFFKGRIHFGKKYGGNGSGIIDKEGTVLVPYPKGQKLYIASQKHELTYHVIGKDKSDVKLVVLENFKGERIFKDTVLSFFYFKNDHAIVTYFRETKVDQKTGHPSTITIQALIDYNGNVIIPKAKQSIDFDIYDPNFVDVKKNGKWRRYNIDGTYFSKLDENKRIMFSAFGDANFGSYYDPEKKLYGVVNKKGEAVTEPIYDNHFEFGVSGYAIAQLPQIK